MQFSGNFTATSGQAPAMVSFVENIALTDTNYTFSKTYQNSDGDLTMTFSADLSNIVSTDTNCNYEEDKDFDILVDTNLHNGFVSLSQNPDVTLTAGDNVLQFRVVPHENRCALEGNWSLTGTIA